MEMSAEEVKQFWRGYCERGKLSKEIIAVIRPVSGKGE